MSRKSHQYQGIWHGLRIIVSQNGFRGLYAGMTDNLLKVMPSMASSWLSFEMKRDCLLSLRPDGTDGE